MDQEEQIRKVAQDIFNADRVIVFSGAGISAESGISTFRDPEVGIWKSKIGLAMFGTPIGWTITPGLAWKCYINYFRNGIARAKPNPGHYAIADLELFCRDPSAFRAKGKTVSDSEPQSNEEAPQQSPPPTSSSEGPSLTKVEEPPPTETPSNDASDSTGSSSKKKRKLVVWKRRHFALITQNVDGLHQRAGNSKERVSEVHGSVYRHRCIRHGHLNEDLSDEVIHNLSSPPKCKTCGGNLRPDATLFTESLPEGDWAKAHHESQMLGSANKNGILIIVGTSGVVYPAASLPRIAAESGPNVVIAEVNPEPSAFTESSLVSTYIRGPGGEVLPRIIEQLHMLQQQEEEEVPAS